MTREEERKRIDKIRGVMNGIEAEAIILDMPCIVDLRVGKKDGKEVCIKFIELEDATASDLRAIADILDQVGKEGEAGK